MLLRGHGVGRVALVDEGKPSVLPVNYVVDEGTIVFRTGRHTTLHAAGGAVAFEIDGTDVDAETGWSVLVKGSMAEVVDAAELETIRRLPLRPWAPDERDQWMRITPETVTGRAISRRRARPDGPFLPYMPPD
jgi:nitroimidazol reductase NimA-like FMN-containing flavoprotein (pyridoxamine 5'-phosphate oxidase superfamily)